MKNKIAVIVTIAILGVIAIAGLAMSIILSNKISDIEWKIEGMTEALEAQGEFNSSVVDLFETII